jgi:hypothetical protein
MIEQPLDSNWEGRPRTVDGPRRNPHVMRAPGRTRSRELTQSVRKGARQSREDAGDRIDARINVRNDARAVAPAGAAPVWAASPFAPAPWPGDRRAVQYSTRDQASVSHPHGEALGPGARSDCAGREKHAFGGTRSQVFSRVQPESRRTNLWETRPSTTGREF